MGDVEVKVILLGGAGVGKSSILKRFFMNEFNDTYIPTQGEFFFVHKYDSFSKKKRFSFNFWDTCGQERYRSINTQYYRDTEIVIYVIDGERETTLNDIEFYVNDFHQKMNSSYEKILVVNKIDTFKGYTPSSMHRESMYKTCPFYNKIIQCKEKFGFDDIIWTSAKLEEESVKEIVTEIEKYVDSPHYELSNVNDYYRSEFSTFAKRATNIRNMNPVNSRNSICNC